MSYPNDRQDGELNDHVHHVLSSEPSISESALKTPSSPRSKSNKLPKRLAVTGLILAIVFGISCMVLGVVTLILIPDEDAGVISFIADSTAQEFARLLLNFCVTICTEAIGFAHGIALRSALAREGRLQYNTLARLTGATRRDRWTGCNGLLGNISMSMLLALTFASSSLTMQTTNQRSDRYTFYINANPLIVLGVCILIQASVAFRAFHITPIITWTTGALEMTSALINDGQLIRVDGRSMCSLVDQGSAPCPRFPALRQPSLWKARRGVRVSIFALWGLIVVYIILGGVTLYFTEKNTAYTHLPWSLLPGANYNVVSSPFFAHATEAQQWTMFFVIYLLTQSWMTLVLHYVEVVANSLHDEWIWRRIGRSSGSKPMANSYASFLANPVKILLLVAKPVLHWMYSLASVAAVIPNGNQYNVLSFGAAQIWNLCFALTFLAIILTLLAIRRPSGPQPAAYGHLQTLANLVDEWPALEGDRVWWGHKGEDESEENWNSEQDSAPVCHAGTSTRKIPPVNFRRMYA